ncbi:uncharacterized protein BDR25DRAFT_301067 [Lindgomyces ingoldianus]|uniref:Uncharacterized protein n=1 Tax=Lindgomyces ingoldianus TaxID=673940 RepID=A0ACB6R7S4_9PLEO|nr:uncharacterized protein BDR25DRAFT_301067 [Lindgomyces ingoldianus]KAF2475354.1 hypothetical protein BDR25DRAFT_301067 [Lindgomyces ingoldianus]
MPNIEIAIKAFNPNFLPADSALRDWITQSFSFLWSTEDHGDYGEFCRGLNLRPTPSEAFLYGIARVRCPFAKGEDIAVLNYWCKVHRHGGGPEERECKKWRDKVSNQALYHLLKEKEESRASEAEELIKVKGGVIVWKHKGIGSPIQTPTQQGKRKMPASGTVASRKKNKSGGTYGSSR